MSFGPRPCYNPGRMAAHDQLCGEGGAQGHIKRHQGARLEAVARCLRRGGAATSAARCLPRSYLHFPDIAGDQMGRMYRLDAMGANTTSSLISILSTSRIYCTLPQKVTCMLAELGPLAVWAYHLIARRSS